MEQSPDLPNLRKRKTLQPKRIATLLSPYSFLAGQRLFSPPSTSAISRAVAVAICISVSLKSFRNASSCRRWVFFPAGCSKSLKVIFPYWSFCHIHSSYYILLFIFLFGYVYTVLLNSQNKTYLLLYRFSERCKSGKFSATSCIMPFYVLYCSV